MLAAIGIYGLMAYSVQHRTQEIGIRMALGAQADRVRWSIVGQGMTLVGVGIVIGVIAAFFVQLLIGCAFATPIYAYSAGLKDETAFSLVFRLGMIPMFLFSGAFFPVSNLDPVLEKAAQLTPLWHGVALCRSLATDDIDPLLTAVHVAYLVALTAVGTVLTVRAQREKLRR